MPHVFSVIARFLKAWRSRSELNLCKRGMKDLKTLFAKETYRFLVQHPAWSSKKIKCVGFAEWPTWCTSERIFKLSCLVIVRAVADLWEWRIANLQVVKHGETIFHNFPIASSRHSKPCFLCHSLSRSIAGFVICLEACPRTKLSLWRGQTTSKGLHEGSSWCFWLFLYHLVRIR